MLHGLEAALICHTLRERTEREKLLTLQFGSANLDHSSPSSTLVCSVGLRPRNE